MCVPRSPCVCVREGGREGGRDVIAGFSDAHGENSRDDISLPRMFLRLGSALVRSARQNISASSFGVLEAALLHLHCCVVIECLHSAHRLIG